MKNYLFTTLEQETIRRTFDDGTMNAEAMFEAHKIIEQAFENLDVMYGPKSKVEKKTTNQSR